MATAVGVIRSGPGVAAPRVGRRAKHGGPGQDRYTFASPGTSAKSLVTMSAAFFKLSIEDLISQEGETKSNPIRVKMCDETFAAASM
jgi:hypothetical protein